jgi:23S rRNA (cytidine1920-2'-O)/16S rRNA (cytidine1409-2'-O)-methyltransferase
VNARHLAPEDFAERFDLAVMDVSFISATKVLPAIVPLIKEAGRAVVLVKPQFEVGKGEVGKGGIVRDAAQHARVVAEVNTAARSLGLEVRGVIDSPVLGAEGNREFLALYERTHEKIESDDKDRVMMRRV